MTRESRLQLGAELGHIDAVPDAIVFVAPTGQVLAWNRAAEFLFGYTRDEALDRDIVKLLMPPAMQSDGLRLREQLLAGRSFVLEGVRSRKDGERIDIEVAATPVYGDTREVRYLSLCYRDITATKRARAAKALEDSFRALLEAAPDGMVIVDAHGVIVAVNERAEQLFGYEPGTLHGEPVEVLVPPVSRAAHLHERFRFRSDARPRPMGQGRELTGWRRDGSEFAVDISLSPLQVGEAVYTAAAVRDTTERRRMEATFRGLLEAAPDAMVITQADGRIALVNSQTEALTGYQREELLGQPIEMLVPDRHRAAHPSHRTGYAEDPHTRPMGQGLDLHVRCKDGREVPVEISLSPLATDAGPLVTAALRDITERRRLEERRREADERVTREAREANRLKSEFLANMSHELRTPLNAIIGFAQLMHDQRVGPVSDVHQEYLGDILTSARHLLQLINDVLDLAKVEAGKLEFHPEPVDARALLSEVCDSLRPLADSRRITLTTHVDPTLGGLFLDAARLKQILYNYLSNALKFTGEGGWVVARLLADGTDSLRVEVADTGVGIEPEDVARLFVEFQQLDAGVAKRHQGTGLGLALTRRLVEAQGGVVGVQSTPAKGSTFFAVLPRTQRGVVDPSLPLAVSLRAEPPLVLVVDDDEAALRLARTTLEAEGYRVHTASDPETALQLAHARMPDVLVVDLLMPRIGGFEFIERVHRLPCAAGVRIVVWTVADVSPAIREHLDRVADRLVGKLDRGPERLREAILQLCPAQADQLEDASGV